MIGVLQTLGLRLVSLQMLRGTFARGLACLGVATGVIGIASSAPARPRLGLRAVRATPCSFGWPGSASLWRLGTAERRPRDRAGTRGPIGSDPVAQAAGGEQP